MTATETTKPSRYRWVVLAIGIAAQASTAAFFQGLASIGPAIRAQGGLTLPQLGIVLGAPTAGLVVTLLPWGAASDRYPERVVMSIGLILTSGFLLLAGSMSGLWPLSIALGLAGSAAASVNAASGRAVLRWFGPARRGFAMGLRQTALPLGAALAAVILPSLVDGGALAPGTRALACGALLAAIASWIWVREPPVVPSQDDHHTPTTGRRQRRAGRSGFGLLIVAGTGLVVCQSTFVSFLVEFLHGDVGLGLREAGLVFVAAQLAGAAGRVLVGVWSDRGTDRLAPLVRISVAIGVAQFLLAALVHGPSAALLPMAVVAGALAICWNGLIFTAVGEMAPPGRTGTALGLQSTANYLTASLVPYAMGSLIGAAGFAVGFGVSGAAGLAVGVMLAVTRSISAGSSMLASSHVRKECQ